MKKIKIKNNSFEVFYLEDDINFLNKKNNILNDIINLIGEYSCFIEYSCDDIAFSDFNIMNYIRRGKYNKLIEVEFFKKINSDMFEGREVIFYFMPKGYEWNEFLSHKYFLGNIFKKYKIKIIIGLNDLGNVVIRYNPIYNENVKCIIDKYNNE